VVGFGAFEGAGADGHEFVRSVNVVDAEEGKRAVVGIGPAGADFVEGVFEFGFKDAVDDIVGRGIEISGDESGESRVGRFLFEDTEGVGELNLPEGAVPAVLTPAIAIKEAEIGSGRLEVDVEELETAPMRHFDSEDLAAVFGNLYLMADGATGDDRTALGSVIAVVADPSEEFVDEMFEVVGVGNFLEEDDVGFEAADGIGGVGAARTIQGDDTEDLASGVSRGRSFGEGVHPQTTERAGLIREDENC
jgi:hypothetical protein